MAFLNKFKYHDYDMQVLNANTFAAFFANFIKIGLLTPEIMRGVTVTFGMRWLKSAYPTKYLSKYWTELIKFSALLDIYMGITEMI